MRRTTSVGLAGAVVMVAALTSPAQEQQELQGPRSALEMDLPEIDLRQVPLLEAIEFLREVTGANIHVSWTALGEAGIDQGRIVTLRLRDVTLRRLLTLMLADADLPGWSDGATFFVEDDIIHITSRRRADRILITRAYPIEDLLHQVPDYPSPIRPKARRIQELLEVLMETVRPEMWLAGPSPEPEAISAVRYHQGHLIVSAPRSVHEVLAEALGR